MRRRPRSTIRSMPRQHYRAPRGGPPSSSRRAGPPRSWRLWAGALSLAAHAALLAMLFFAWTRPAEFVEPRAVSVALVRLTRPRPPAPVPAPTPPRHGPPKPTQLRVRRLAPAPPAVETLRAAPAMPSLSDSELAGAGGDGGAGPGGGGGGCDMTARVQSALRRDPLVRAAVSAMAHDAAGARAIWVWKGDWIQNRSEDGKGLAAVREAIMWEVAFAPAPCRARPMRGLVLLAVSDGAPRLALGGSSWRWADLLGSSR